MININNTIKQQIIELSDNYKQIFNSRGYEYKLLETDDFYQIKIIIQSTLDDDLCKIDFNEFFNCETLIDKEIFVEEIDNILNFAYSCQKIKEELEQEEFSINNQNLILPFYLNYLSLSNKSILNEEELNQKIINFIEFDNIDILTETNRSIVIDKISNFDLTKEDKINSFKQDYIENNIIESQNNTIDDEVLENIINEEIEDSPEQTTDDLELILDNQETEITEELVVEKTFPKIPPQNQQQNSDKFVGNQKSKSINIER